VSVADDPLVTVCMPAGFRPHEFEGALRSVLAQTYPKLEVVVSDDSGGALRSAVDQADDPRVRYFANPAPLGFADNHTTSLARARGDLLAFLHDDDEYLPTYLESVLAVFRRDPMVGLVTTDCWTERAGAPRGRRGVPYPGGRHDDFLRHLISRTYVLPSTTVMRRAVWESTSRRWPDTVVADVPMWVEAAVAGWPFYYLPEPLVLYRYHAGQLGGDELRHRNDVIDMWGSYTFADPTAEELRRRRLAGWLMARCGTWLRAGDAGAAREDLRRARREHRRAYGPRGALLELLVRAPWLVPLVEGTRRRFSEPGAP
jgi:glycosyltransferase involved in cell wall biosynthesis